MLNTTPEDTLKKEYQIRIPVDGRKSFTVTMPYEVVEREARRKKMSLEKFLEKYLAVAHYNNFDGIYYTFEQKSLKPGANEVV